MARTGGTRLRRGATAFALVVFAFLARTTSWPAIFTEGDVRPLGPDGYYHLRRIEWTLAHYPEVLHRDRYLNHPHGGDVIWAPGFDWGVASVLRLVLGAEPETERLERAAMFVPPVLGALTVLGLWALALRRFGEGVAALAGGLLALLPAHATYSQLGMLDHHVAEAVAVLALLASALALLRAADAPAPRARWLAGAVCGLAMAGALLVWPGCLLLVGLVDAVGVGAFWALADPGRARRVAAPLAGAHALAALLLLPFSGTEWELWGAFAPVVLSRFQPWLLGSVAATLGLTLAATSGRGPVGRGRGARVAVSLALAVVVVATSAALLPALAAAPGEMWSWFARTESFQAQVAESRPLFSAGVRNAVEMLSWLVFAFPLALVLFALPRRPGRPASPERPLLEDQALVGFGAGLGVAALAQTRFANAFALPFALLTAWLLVAALPAAWRARPRGVRAAAGAALVLGVAVALVPCLDWYGRWLDRIARGAAGKPLGSIRLERRHELHRLAHWMRGHTPETAGYLDPAQRPEYGVMAHWTNGHILEQVARRPTVVDNFGDDVGPENMELSQRYFAAAEPEASALLDALDVRYVVVECHGGIPLTRFGPESVVARLYFGDGAESDHSVRGGGARHERVAGSFPAFDRHRLVYETRDKPWRPRAHEPVFKLYEHVAGARLEGAAAPGAPVEARLGVVTNRGRRFTWRATTRADAGGRWSLRVPYATRGAPPAVTTDPAYTLSVGSRSLPVVVDDEAVRAGSRVPVEVPEPAEAGDGQAGRGGGPGAAGVVASPGP